MATQAPPYRQQAQSSGASGPANVAAQPRPDPVQAASASGPPTAQLRAAWEAYRGNWQGPLKPLADQPDLNVLANRCGPIVRTGVDFLFGPVLKMEHPTQSCQDILTAVWGDDDHRMTTLSKCAINGGVYGHVFVKIVNPKNRKPYSVDNPPRLVVQNPELYKVKTDPDDCDLVTCYYCTWQDSDGQTWHQQRTERVDPDDPDLSEGNNYNDPALSEQDADAHWEISNWQRSGGPSNDDDAWQQVGETIIWPYPFAPIVDWQHYPNPNDHWGAADVDSGLINLNKQLHLVESNTNAVQYSHGHPWLFASGTDTGGITPTPGTITDLGSVDAKITAITASGDVANMMNFAGTIRENMDEETATPAFLIGRGAEMPKGPVPGITIRLMALARLNRMEHQRRLYGCGIRELCRAVLILCGQETAAVEEDVVLTWQDPLPQDDLATAQMAVAAQQTGMSTHYVCTLLGVDYDQEMEMRAEEQKEAARAAMQGQAFPQTLPPPMMGAKGAQQQQQMGAGASGQPGALGDAGQPSASAPAPNGQIPPMMHPQAVRARQSAQIAAGKKPTMGGLK